MKLCWFMVLFMVNQELNGALLPIGFLADSFSSFIVINHIVLVRIADEMFMFIRILELASWPLTYLSCFILLRRYCYWCLDHIELIARPPLKSEGSFLPCQLSGQTDWHIRQHTPRAPICVWYVGAKQISRPYVDQRENLISRFLHQQDLS